MMKDLNGSLYTKIMKIGRAQLPSSLRSLLPVDSAEIL